MRYGFIGTGNMAGAIIKGMVGNGFDGKEISCYDINLEKTEQFCAEWGVNLTRSVGELIQQSDCVVLSVKPNVFQTLLPQIAGQLRVNGTLVASIAAGKTIGEIETLLGYHGPVARIMPNINAQVGESMSAVCFNEGVSPEQKEAVQRVFQAIGQSIELEEAYFGIFSAIAGCSPAFTYMYIDSLAKAAHRAGMKKQDAVRIAAQAVLGSAKMLLQSEEHPLALADKVCSPGGTTIEGVCALEENNFQSTIVKAVEAAYRKDMRL